MASQEPSSTIDTIKEKAKQVGEAAYERAKDYADHVKEKAVEFDEEAKAKGDARRAKEAGQEGITDKIADKVQVVGDTIKDGARDIGLKVSDQYQKAKDYVTGSS